MPDLATLIAFSPMILIPFVIIFKIIMSKNFNNTIFSAILISLICLSLITLTITFYMGQSFFSGDVYTPLMHKINYPLGTVSTIYFTLLNKILLIFYGILFIYCIIKYIQTKDFSLLKRFGTTSLFVGILMIFSIPTIVYPIYKVDSYENKITQAVTTAEINKAKLATKISILPAMKGYYSEITTLNLSLYIFNQYAKDAKIPDYSSKEAQELIDECIEYYEQSANLRDYSEYLRLALFCYQTRRLDDALKYALLAQSYGMNADEFISSIYIAMNDYKKALEYTDKNSNAFSTKKKLTAIYIGLCEFNKAEEIINKNQNEKNYKTWASQAKIYLNYKKGNTNLSKELFEKFSKNNPRFSKYSYEEFIKYTQIYGY